MHVFEREFRLGAGDHRAICVEHAAGQNNFTFHGLRLPDILEPCKPFLIREEICVNDVTGLDHGLLGRDFRRGDADAAIEMEVREARGDQPHMTINSGAGIPAQGRFERIVHPHGQDVGRAVGFQKFGEIITEADEAVGSASEELAVDPDLAVHINPVELDDDLLAGGVRKRETFPIPADAVREKAVIAVALRRRRERAFDAPVVRQVEGAPVGVIELGLLGRRLVAQMEAPACVEGNDFPRAGRGLGGGRGENEAGQGGEIESEDERCEC